MHYESPNLKERVSMICSTIHTQDSRMLAELTNEHSTIENKILKLIKEDKEKEYTIEISNLILASKHIKMIFGSLLNQQISINLCIVELIRVLRTFISLIKDNGKITI